MDIKNKRLFLLDMDGTLYLGDKLFEGVDYEVEQTNALGLPGVVRIINSNYYSATITADYYTWKTNLTVDQIVAGLVALAGYNSSTEDIRSVAWNTAVRTQETPTLDFSVGYKFENANLINVSSPLYIRKYINISNRWGL